jgi:trk system potassium uptake protein TrkA
MAADSALVIGLGRFGSSVVKELHCLKYDIAVCDVDEKNLMSVDAYTMLGIQGDAKDDSILNELSVEDYDTVVVAIGDNFESSILITKKLKDRGCKQVFCKANDKQRGEILLAVGADRVIFPEEESGTRLAKRIGFKGLVDFFEITDSVSALELPVPDSFIGKTLRDLDFTHRFSLTVAFILRNRKPILTGLGTEVFASGDYFFVIGDNKSLHKFQNNQYD